MSKIQEAIREALVANMLDGWEGGTLTMGCSAMATEAAEIAADAVARLLGLEVPEV